MRLMCQLQGGVLQTAKNVFLELCALSAILDTMSMQFKHAPLALTTATPVTQTETVLAAVHQITES